MSRDRSVFVDPWIWVAIGVMALIVAAIAIPNLPRSRYAAEMSRRYAEQGTGLASLQPVAFGLHSGDAAVPMASPSPNASPSPDRKLIRTSTLDMVVKTPSQSSEQIVRLAEGAGGFLVSSQVSGSDTAPTASLTVRVPAAQYEAIRAQIRQLGLRVESERVEAEDVTKQYVDQEARLRNLRAQEQQYLGILRQASTVKDTLAVSEQLNSVRGEIEQQQAEFEALSKQVETVAINVTLRAEADTQVFGLHWRPLYQLKVAARQGLDGLGDYANSMASFLFLLPSIVLWTATIILGAALCWRLLRWAGRVLFKFPKPAAAA